MHAPLPEGEAERLAALRDHCILDTPPTEEFDDLVRLAAQICGVPIAAVSLIDENRQWFKAITGLDATETPRDVAFCAHTILQADMMVVADTHADPRFADNPLVTGDPHLRFYAGITLVSEEGHALGSLCVLDRMPQTLTAEQEAALRLLARQAGSQLRAARRIAEYQILAQEKARLVADQARMAAIIESSEEAIIAWTMEGLIVSWNAAAERLYGYTAAEMIGQPSSVLAQSEERRLGPVIVGRLLRGEKVEPIEAMRVRKDGESLHVLLSFSPIRDAAGQMVGVSCVSRDITTRKRVEAALAESNSHLQESEERLRRLTDAAFEGIAVSQDGELKDVSPAFAALFGYDGPAEMIGLAGIGLAAPESQADVAAKIAACDEEPYEATLLRRDGTVFEAELRVRMIHIGGRPARVTAVRDITVRKRMEQDLREYAERLRESEAGLRAVLESAPVILYAADADGTVTLSEGTGLEALGLRPGDAVGRSVFEFSGGDTEIEEKTRRALAGETLSFDMRMDGLSLHTELRPVLDADGSPEGIIGVCFDVTERALAEERFRVLFEHSSDAHLLLGEGGLIDCNPAAVAMLGCQDKAQLLGLHPAVMSPEFQPDGRLSREKKGEMDALARENGFHRFEWVMRKTDGEEFPVEVTLTPVTLAGRPVLLSVQHDLTERKRAEEQVKDYAVVLELQKSELEKANAELASLATSDGLTGLKNHRAFQERLAVEAGLAARHGEPLSLVILDVDHFKKYNDAHGHPARDSVLRAVAHSLQDAVRETDLAARYGGEEFVLLLPQTDLQGAAVVAERVRKALEGRSWPLRSVTGSFGVATLRTGEGGADLIARADAAMYESKVSGRNRVTCGKAATPHCSVR